MVGVTELPLASASTGSILVAVDLDVMSTTTSGVRAEVRLVE